MRSSYLFDLFIGQGFAETVFMFLIVISNINELMSNLILNDNIITLIVLKLIDEFVTFYDFNFDPYIMSVNKVCKYWFVSLTDNSCP